MEYTAIITTIPARRGLLARALHSVIQQQLAPRQIIIVIDRGGGQQEQPQTLGQGRQVQSLVMEQEEEGRSQELNQQQIMQLGLSQALIKRHNITIVLNHGKGISAARNTGIKSASCEWVAFLDDDDEWRPNKMHEQAELIAANNSSAAAADTKRTNNELKGLYSGAASNSCRLCHSDELWLRRGKELKQLAKHRKQGGRIYPNCLELCCVSPSAVVMHRSLFSDYGLFDERLPVCEDYDLWLRICAYEKVLFAPKPLVIKHGGHAGQLSKRYWGMDRFRVYAAQQMLRDPKLPPPYRALTQQSIKRRLAILAQGAAKRNKQMFSNYYEHLLAGSENPPSRSIYHPRVN